MTEPASNRMPGGIPFIIANEFAERFCFYGINSILTLYLLQFLHFGEAEATTWGSLFKSGAYFFPLAGAVVSDVFWAKYRTVITFSLAYCAGCAVLALAREPSTIALGLFLVAFGTGGIKPCVATNLGDQFTSANQHLIERAFSLFYLAVNSGSLISISLCPWLLPAYGPTVPMSLSFGYFACTASWIILKRDSKAGVMASSLPMARYSRLNGLGCPASARTLPHFEVDGPLAYSTRSRTSCMYAFVSASGRASCPFPQLPSVFWQETPAGTTGRGFAPMSSQNWKYSKYPIPADW